MVKVQSSLPLIMIHVSYDTLDAKTEGQQTDRYPEIESGKKKFRADLFVDHVDHNVIKCVLSMCC